MLKQKAFNKKFMASFTAVLMVVMMMSVSVFANWTTFQNDNFNQGVVTSGTAPTSVTTGTTLNLGSAAFNGIDVEPLIANYGGVDYAYVLNTDANNFSAHRINLATKARDWGTGGVTILNKNDFQLSTPVIDGTTLYVAGTDATHRLVNPYFDTNITGWTTDISGAGTPSIAWAASAGFMSGGAKINQGTGSTATTGSVRQSQTFSTGMGQLNFYYVVDSSTVNKPTGASANVQISTNGGSTWTTIYTSSSITPGTPVYVTQDVTSYFSSSATYLVKFEASFTTAAASDGFAFFDTCDLTNYAPFLKRITNINTTSPTVSNVITMTGGGQFNSPLIYDNGFLYGGVWRDQAQGDYYRVNATTGAVTAFGGLLSGDGFYNAGAATGGNLIGFGGEKSRVYVYSKSNLSNPASTYDIKGSGSGQEPTAGPIRSSITYDNDGHIYFTDTGGYLWCLDVDTTTGALSHNWHEYIGPSTSTPAFFDGNLYVGVGNFSTNGAVVSYVGGDALFGGGTLRWTYTTAAGGMTEAVQSSPVVYNNGSNTYVYFTTNDFDGAGYCIQDNGSSASQVWRYPASGGTYTVQGFAISNGYAVFGNDAGDVHIVQ